MGHRNGGKPASGGIRVRQYLVERGVSIGQAHRLYGPFGKAVKRRFMAARDSEPGTVGGHYNGAPTSGCEYPEDFRPVFDEVFNELTKPIRNKAARKKKKPRRNL